MLDTEELPVLEVPELPTEHPCLLFTPDEVQRMKMNRDTYAWARHAYYEALLMAERINRPTPAGGDDDWMVNPMDFTDKGRQREHLYSSFCSTLIDCFEVGSKYDRTYHYVLHGEGTYTSPLISREVESLGRGHGYDFLAGIRGGDIVDHWEATLAQGSWDSHLWRPTGTGMRVRSIEPMPGRLYAAKALHGKAHGFEDCLIIETYGREKRFLNCLEPYQDEPKITSVQSHPCNGLFLVEVEYEDGRDLIFYSPAERGTFGFRGYTFEGRFLFLKFDAEDNRSVAVGADALSLACDGRELHASGEGADFDLS